MTKHHESGKEQEYLDNWKRAQADFENYKKDEKRRIENAMELGKETLIHDFLEVKDDLEKALESARSDDAGHREGIAMTLKKFNDILERYGVHRVKTEGETFDPEVHEAVQVAQAEGPPGHVVQEIRAGYTMHGKVIRPARVIINK